MNPYFRGGWVGYIGVVGWLAMSLPTGKFLPWSFERKYVCSYCGIFQSHASTHVKSNSQKLSKIRTKECTTTRMLQGISERMSSCTKELTLPAIVNKIFEPGSLNSYDHCSRLLIQVWQYLPFTCHHIYTLHNHQQHLSNKNQPTFTSQKKTLHNSYLSKWQSFASASLLQIHVFHPKLSRSDIPLEWENCQWHWCAPEADKIVLTDGFDIY